MPSSSSVVVNGADEQQSLAAIPVTILSGFLGSGKTTLLRHILTNPHHKLKIAVIVNDMAELNVDAHTIQRTLHDQDAPDASGSSSPMVVQSGKRELIALENGCICCTLRGDLIREIRRIQQTNSFDYIIIESTGIAEPQQVAESFCVDPDTLALVTAGSGEGEDEPESLENGNGSAGAVQLLNDFARLDTCVTVVDTACFALYLNSLRRFHELFNDGMEDENDEEGRKSIAELMVEQVEFANVVLLNKIDLASAKQVDEAKKLIRSLNPKALVATASHGKMNVKDVLNTGLFDMEEAKESPGWLVSLQNGVNADHGEADEYGVVSFVYRATKPFHPKQLNDNFLSRILNFAGDWNLEGVQERVEERKRRYMEDRYGCILRSKGSIWIAGRDKHEFGWAHSGRIIEINPVAPWYCNVPEEKWNCETEEEKERIQSKFVKGSDYGDRRQEIVFIGIGMKADQIRGDLDACLLTNEEMAGHALELPLGAYHDTLPPLLFDCVDAGSIFVMVRPRQNQHFLVPPSFKLTLSNLALVVDGPDDEGTAFKAPARVRVWLDKCPSTGRTHQHGTLLATLRPETHEQHALSLSLLHSEGKNSEPSDFRLRVEVVESNRGRKRTTPSGDDVSPSETTSIGIAVHVMGSVEPVPYSADDGDEEEVDDGTDRKEDCLDGDCDMDHRRG